jgi:hypothetical protein
VYQDMRRAFVLITSLALLAVAATPAQAKTGVIYQKDPETAKVGEKVRFTVVVFSEPRTPGGQAGPISGRRPLVTFRSRSGAVIRVRSTRTGADGVGHGAIAFSDKGPWTTRVTLPGVHMLQEPSVPLSVGIGLVQTIPPATAPHNDHAGTAFPWTWVLSLLAIGSALLVFVTRRRGHWGAT